MMVRSTLAGVTYFAIVFAVGFVLGTMRVLVVAPSIGVFGAVLLETPFILAASWIACGWLIQRARLTSASGSRLWMGMVAFLLLVIVEPVLAHYGFGRGWAQQFQALAQPAGLLGVFGQLMFAIIPLIRSK